MASVLLGVIFFILGFVLGGLIVFFAFRRYLSKNPPITEKQIKLMFKQMGRNPGEKQIKQIMANIKNQK
ncbi:MAG: YneF family protein [Candidatus Phytoplasma stylosanthis]|uniref:YneF family protein n=1 Tax=Candidatus Phytoplasma stylosanthis TaxID=2798314 RepID=UPI0029398125|nr:YneF family protein [Candidatus Phytoplasma stylosanthis]MDV3167943.1 YneF family protein [Candidatus Phytoplasma stylosanthis]MDV3171036.1 YneF family protein [Candidatus Phytoplasma stylosanthis]MDV3173624.1 YneF family protein [Candidatus Phytoplasma stylosanthis]MDV3174242.1 YneF family protein [Candidatus Phytoplasma stylosanthis]MDV3202701.1 YneF family protein [Candidatus Phytoplasma stylosanthis]